MAQARNCVQGLLAVHGAVHARRDAESACGAAVGRTTTSSSSFIPLRHLGCVHLALSSSRGAEQAKACYSPSKGLVLWPLHAARAHSLADLRPCFGQFQLDAAFRKDSAKAADPRPRRQKSTSQARGQDGFVCGVAMFGDEPKEPVQECECGLKLGESGRRKQGAGRSAPFPGCTATSTSSPKWLLLDRGRSKP